MNSKNIAPCGLNCALCLGFQREKNKCVGCLGIGNKPNHCTSCSIKNCTEKKQHDGLLCFDCKKFPCKLIKNIDKRYRTRYGVSAIINFETIAKLGIRAFLKSEKEKWTCPKCGELLCMHRKICLHCGAKNLNYPI